MEDGGFISLIVVFNINDNTILQCVDNERIVYAFRCAVSWNKKNNEKNGHNFIGMTIVPEEGWTWDEARLNEYLNEQKKWGQVMVMTNGWTYK